MGRSTTAPVDRRASRVVKDLPPLLDINDVAVRLGVNTRHVRRLVTERRIPYIKWGHLLRFEPQQIQAWLDRSGVEPRRY